MGIYRRKDRKHWLIRITTPAGRRIQVSTKTDDRRAAQQLHDQIKNDLWRQENLGEKPQHWWKEAVLKWLKEQSPERSSLSNNILTFKWLSSHLDKKRLHEIDRDCIERIAEAKERLGVAGSTVNKTLDLIQNVLNRAYKDWGWLDKVPPIRKRKIPLPRDRWIKEEEAIRLISELPEHQKEIVIFTLSVGLRHSNAVKMKWEVVDLSRRHAYVQSFNAKSKKAFSVPLNDIAMEILTKRLRADDKHPEYIFTYRGKPIKRANGRAWREAVKRAGITDFRWHDLRHTWASWHVQNGTPLCDLMKMGPWSKMDMVMRYAHQSSDNLQDAANRICGAKLVQSKKE